MATPTYTLLDSVTLASSAASVTFSGIPQTYGDLVLVSNSATIAFFRFNGDTGNNYALVNMYGTGSSAISTVNPTNPAINAVYGSPMIAQIMDYSLTDKHKSLLIRSGAASSRALAIAARWANTNAITQITFTPPSGTYSAGDTFFLYGIAKAL